MTNVDEGFWRRTLRSVVRTLNAVGRTSHLTSLRFRAVPPLRHVIASHLSFRRSSILFKANSKAT